jgi:hypothetical protein
MEKAVLNIDILNVTQGMNGSYSHKGDLAIDISRLSGLRAPFTGKIKRIYTNCNAVWLESVDKVKYADGTEDYMTVLTIHDNSVTSLYVGKTIKQGEIYYQQGTKGKVTGAHIHIAVGKGKFSGSGWYQNEYGSWPINNQYDITKALFVYKGVNQANPMYDWKETSDFVYDKPKTIEIGSKVKINTIPPYKYYVADDVQNKYGIYQIRENVNAGGEKNFEWKDNGIPEVCVDLVHSDGRKRSDSDKVHAKKGDKFVFAKTFTVKKIAYDNNRKYFLLDFDGNADHRFWVIGDYLRLV